MRLPLLTRREQSRARRAAGGRRNLAEDGLPCRDKAWGEIAPVPPRRLRQLLRRHQLRAYEQTAGIEGRAVGAFFADGGEEDTDTSWYWFGGSFDVGGD
jgi:hypothetical protein